MKIVRINNEPIAAEELKSLEKLKALIERAIADGFLSKEEMESIQYCMSADGKITPQELQLCQQLMWDKITLGELSYDWSE